MDNFERVAYVLLAVVALAWLGVLLVGAVAAFPFGLVILVALLAVGILLIKIVKERLQSSEDDYYDRNVKR